MGLASSGVEGRKGLRLSMSLSFFWDWVSVPSRSIRFHPSMHGEYFPALGHVPVIG